MTKKTGDKSDAPRPESGNLLMHSQMFVRLTLLTSAAYFHKSRGL